MVVKSTDTRQKVKGFTIDGPFSKDLDDAIWVRLDDDKNLFVDVSIADVANFVPKGSDLDKQAFTKAFTRYYETSNDPMFPRDLSEDQASLIPHCSRNAITVSFPVSKSGEVLKPTIYKSVLQSVCKLSYERVDEMIKLGGEYQDQLVMLNNLAQKLMQGRRDRGALVIYDIMSGWATSEDGKLYRIEDRDRHLANIIVQEMMIMTNVAVAEFLLEKDAPALFRNHTASRSAPSQEVMMNDLLSVIQSGEASRLETTQKRWKMVLNRADYGPKLVGHYGLNLPAYLHFTSPIRRYADLVNHRIISSLLSGEPIPYSVEELEEIASHLNVVQKEIKDRTRQHFVNQARKELQNEAEKNPLALFSTSNFTKILKVACNENGFTPELEEAIIQRLDSHKLMVRDFYSLLIEAPKEEPWVKSRESAAVYLSKHPAICVSILTLLEQNGRSSAPVYHYKPFGPANQRTFSCHAVLKAGENKIATNPFLAKTKKEARDKTAWFLVAALALIELSEISDDSSSAATVSQIDTVTLTDNFKSRLLEKCQGNGWQHPEFITRDEGLVHERIFFAIATLNVYGENYESDEMSASTKKLAEQLASRSLLEKIPDDVPKPKVIPATMDSLSYINLLMETCVKVGLSFPAFRDEQEGPSNAAIFTVYCSVNGLEPAIETSAKNYTKKKAKNLAAQSAYEQLLLHPICQ